MRLQQRATAPNQPGALQKRMAPRSAATGGRNAINANTISSNSNRPASAPLASSRGGGAPIAQGGPTSRAAQVPRHVSAGAVATPKVDKVPSTMHSSIVVPEPVKPPSPRLGPILGPELGALYRRFRKLQNGSDVRGVAIDGVPGEPLSLTVGAAYFIGVAFGRWLRSKAAPPTTADSPAPPLHVAVGRDPRLSGELVEGAVAAGLASEGVDVTLVGLATTPCMFYSLVHQPGEYQGSIMITASHQPWNMNGLKFFVPGGGLEKNNITELVTIATQACGEAGVMLGEPWAEQALVLASARSPKGTIHHRDFRPLYASLLRRLIVEGVSGREPSALPLLGLKIVVDSGNGAGGFFATEVLAPLGADISGSRYLDPDGSFPNHPANPEHPSAMASGAQAVLQAGADLGIVFDTDVDRSAIVDRHGREINSNRFIALMAAIVLREHPGTTVVTDSVTSNGLAEFITQLGGRHVRFKRGYKNVIGKGVQLNKQGVETHLMMETSGHGAIKENYFLDDGAFLAVKVIIELVRRRQAGADIGDLLAQLKEPLESKEFRVRITDPDHAPVGAKVLERFHKWVTTTPPPGWQVDAINHEGWRVNIDEGDGKVGWVLLRQSLHDPLLVLNVESEVEGGALVNMRKVTEFLVEHCSGLPIDVSVLRL